MKLQNVLFMFQSGQPREQGLTAEILFAKNYPFELFKNAQSVRIDFSRAYIFDDSGDGCRISSAVMQEFLSDCEERYWIKVSGEVIVCGTGNEAEEFEVLGPMEDIIRWKPQYGLLIIATEVNFLNLAHCPLTPTKDICC